MSIDDRHMSFRILCLITTPKLCERASEMFLKGAIPVQYHINALGTAPSEIIDIMGLGSSDKRILLSSMPKSFADKILEKLKKELQLGYNGSGIAFTLPLSGINNLILRMMEQMEENEQNAVERKDEHIMSEAKHSLVAVIVNQGYSAEVIEKAREAGATGGTIVNTRRVGNSEVMGFWGMSAQEEKEVLLILTQKENKLKIMQTVSESFGIRSEAKGVVLSVPVDSVIGID